MYWNLSDLFDFFKNQKMCNKAVDTYSPAKKIVSDRYKAQETCYKVVSKEPFVLKYCFDRYNSRELCDKAVDAFLPILKFVPDWFVTSKILKKLYDVVFSNNAIVFVNEDSDNITFLSDDMGINTIE